MIYTVIADINEPRKVQKRDCHIAWQPLSLIPDEVLEYVNSAKSEKVRAERLAAYSALFTSLDKLFGKRNFALLRTADGKPYLTENGEKSSISISISHSEGLAAVSLSTDGEIGVDIQSEIATDVAEKLEKRFFDNVKVTDTSLESLIYFIELSASGEPVLTPISETDKIKLVDDVGLEFTKKWAFSESVLKCCGTGFLGAANVNELSQNTKTAIYTLLTKTSAYALAITKKQL